MYLVHAPAAFHEVLVAGYGSAKDRARAVRDDQVGLEFHLESQAVALWARSERRVEGEVARLYLPQGDAVLGAGVLAGIKCLLLPAADDHGPVPFLQGALYGLMDALPALGGDKHLVYQDGDALLPVLVELRDLPADVRERPADVHLVEPGFPQALELFFEAALLAAGKGGEHLHLLPGEAREEARGYLVRPLPRYRLMADRAVGLADAREKQPEIIVDLGRRANGGARIP